MGALEYAPATAGFETSSSVQIDSLYQLAKKLFQEREKAIVLSGEALNLQSLYEVGTSAGGQHPKAIIAINRETGDIRSGQVALPPDYTYYILKFAESDDFPFTNVEMAYYEMALLKTSHSCAMKRLNFMAQCNINRRCLFSLFDCTNTHTVPVGIREHVAHTLSLRKNPFTAYSVFLYQHIFHRIRSGQSDSFVNLGTTFG